MGGHILYFKTTATSKPWKGFSKNYLLCELDPFNCGAYFSNKLLKAFTAL